MIHNQSSVSILSQQIPEPVVYEPKHLKRWRSADNYLGPEYPDHYVWLARTRDSDALEESNFHCGLAAIGGEHDDVVLIHRAGHWACGWVEVVLIERTAAATLRIADDIARKLVEEYPVIDEDDYARLREDRGENEEDL